MRWHLLFTLPILAFAEQNTAPKLYDPWFTGPFLAPIPVNMEKGHPGIQAAFVATYNYGLYNDHWKVTDIAEYWSFNYFVDYQFAITKRTGVEVFAGAYTNVDGSKSSTHLQDSSILLGYQISNDQKDSWVPDCRLWLEIDFPTGNYKQLNPKLLGLDLTGSGAYFFGPGLAIQKLFYLPKNYLSLQWSLSYHIPTRVYIKGFNAYQGGVGAKGSIVPGQFLIAFFSGQYSFNQNWVFMFDSSFQYQQEAHGFRGNPGTLLNGTPSTVGRPTFMQFSLALELAYNFSASSGLLWGVWASLAGRNAFAFGSAFISYLYIF